MPICPLVCHFRFMTRTSSHTHYITYSILIVTFMRSTPLMEPSCGRPSAAQDLRECAHPLRYRPTGALCMLDRATGKACAVHLTGLELIQQRSRAFILPPTGNKRYLAKSIDNLDKVASLGISETSMVKSYHRRSISLNIIYFRSRVVRSKK